jgi:hypothetical protein
MWELADLCASHCDITLKSVFKLKKDEAKTVIKHKATFGGVRVRSAGRIRLRRCIHTCRADGVRVLVSIAQEGCRVHHPDVKSAFLNADLKEAYVRQSLRFIIPVEENKVLRLCKALCDRHYELGMPSCLDPQADGVSNKVLTRLLSTSRAREDAPCW